MRERPRAPSSAATQVEMPFVARAAPPPAVAVAPPPPLELMDPTGRFRPVAGHEAALRALGAAGIQANLNAESVMVLGDPTEENVAAAADALAAAGLRLFRVKATTGEIVRLAAERAATAVAESDADGNVPVQVRSARDVPLYMGAAIPNGIMEMFPMTETSAFEARAATLVGGDVAEALRAGLLAAAWRAADGAEASLPKPLPRHETLGQIQVEAKAALGGDAAPMVVLTLAPPAFAARRSQRGAVQDKQKLLKLRENLRRLQGVLDKHEEDKTKPVTGWEQRGLDAVLCRDCHRWVLARTVLRDDGDAMELSEEPSFACSLRRLPPTLAADAIGVVEDALLSPRLDGAAAAADAVCGLVPQEQVCARSAEATTTVALAQAREGIVQIAADIRAIEARMPVAGEGSLTSNETKLLERALQTIASAEQSASAAMRKEQRHRRAEVVQHPLEVAVPIFTAAVMAYSDDMTDANLDAMVEAVQRMRKSGSRYRDEAVRWVAAALNPDAISAPRGWPSDPVPSVLAAKVVLSGLEGKKPTRAAAAEPELRSRADVSFAAERTKAKRRPPPGGGPPDDDPDDGPEGGGGGAGAGDESEGSDSEGGDRPTGLDPIAIEPVGEADPDAVVWARCSDCGAQRGVRPVVATLELDEEDQAYRVTIAVPGEFAEPSAREGLLEIERGVRAIMGQQASPLSERIEGSRGVLTAMVPFFAPDPELDEAANERAHHQYDKSLAKFVSKARDVAQDILDGLVSSKRTPFSCGRGAAFMPLPPLPPLSAGAPKRAAVEVARRTIGDILRRVADLRQQAADALGRPSHLQDEAEALQREIDAKASDPSQRCAVALLRQRRDALISSPAERELARLCESLHRVQEHADVVRDAFRQIRGAPRLNEAQLAEDERYDVAMDTAEDTYAEEVQHALVAMGDVPDDARQEDVEGDIKTMLAVTTTAVDNLEGQERAVWLDAFGANDELQAELDNRVDELSFEAFRNKASAARMQAGFVQSMRDAMMEEDQGLVAAARAAFEGKDFQPLVAAAVGAIAGLGATDAAQIAVAAHEAIGADAADAGAVLRGLRAALADAVAKQVSRAMRAVMRAYVVAQRAITAAARQERADMRASNAAGVYQAALAALQLTAAGSAIAERVRGAAVGPELSVVAAAAEIAATLMIDEDDEIQKIQDLLLAKRTKEHTEAKADALRRETFGEIRAENANVEAAKRDALSLAVLVEGEDDVRMHEIWQLVEAWTKAEQRMLEAEKLASERFQEVLPEQQQQKEPDALVAAVPHAARYYFAALDMARRANDSALAFTAFDLSRHMLEHPIAACVAERTAAAATESVLQKSQRPPKKGDTAFAGGDTAVELRFNGGCWEATVPPRWYALGPSRKLIVDSSDFALEGEAPRSSFPLFQWAQKKGVYRVHPDGAKNLALILQKGAKKRPAAEPAPSAAAGGGGGKRAPKGKEAANRSSSALASAFGDTVRAAAELGDDDQRAFAAVLNQDMQGHLRAIDGTVVLLPPDVSAIEAASRLWQVLATLHAMGRRADPAAAVTALVERGWDEEKVFGPP